MRSHRAAAFDGKIPINQKTARGGKSSARRKRQANLKLILTPASQEKEALSLWHW